MVQLRKHVVDSILYHLYTGFLFTKSDIKTTVIPIVSRLCSEIYSDNSQDFIFSDLDIFCLSSRERYQRSPSCPVCLLDMASPPAVRRLQPDLTTRGRRNQQERSPLAFEANNCKAGSVVTVVIGSGLLEFILDV